MDDIIAARDRLKGEGARVLGDGEPKIGAHGKPVLFLHPEGFLRHAGRARTGLMALSTAIAIYFLIWWLTLFAVLPWGVRAQGEEATPGTDPGAPRVHNVGRKLIWTTIVATVIFAVGDVRLRLSGDLARRSRGLDGLRRSS